MGVEKTVTKIKRYSWSLDISTTIARNIFNTVSIYLLGPLSTPPPSALSTLYVKDFSFKS